MSNPTNFQAPNNVAQLRTTDYRPNKALYENVVNNNEYRLYMQRNGDKIRQQQMDVFLDKMASCGCEPQHSSIKKHTPGYVCPRHSEKQ